MVLHCTIVGFGARAVSRKTPIYFMIFNFRYLHRNQVLPERLSLEYSPKRHPSPQMMLRVGHVLGAGCLLFCYAILVFFQPAVSIDLTKRLDFDSELKPNILDGCRYVYLDMGTNQ